MQIDPSNSPTAGGDAVDGHEKKSVTSLRRAGQIGLSLINPFSDLMVIYRKGVVPTLDRMKLLREIVTPSTAVRELLSWAQAVQRAGKPIEQLRISFKRIRAAWWFLMAVPGILSILLLMMVMATKFNLPSGTLIRALVTTLVLVALGGIGFVKTLVATYRLWQLDAQRVSEEEHGTFKDFLTENRWFLQVLTIGLIR
ncbi:conjugal transfer protein TraX [Pseudomonas sp. AB6]|uniref:conjugal transfer protein TraX n=1 Tax=Pseudomonas sp. AB6 TaxID=3048598 RepID=UPI002AB350D0|nr:conjugal transfer protein TraX [Pseudomonas sp. AB6]MDY7563405.1 conjugal transfer protein TraX [Pseudomonas sp. AB6]MEB0213426.1 conjugal transfer protein TraX [Pseudomonas sp. AB6]